MQCKLAQDFVIVLANFGRRDAADARRGVRQFREGVLHLELAPFGRFHLDQCFAGGEMRIFEHFGRAIDFAGRDAVLDHQRFEFLDGQRLGPFGDNLVEFAQIARAGDVGGVTLVLCQIGAAHRVAQAAEDGVLIGADQIFAIAARIDVRRRHAFEDRPGARADVLRHHIFGDEAFHDL